jgi:hypothetical protein
VTAPSKSRRSAATSAAFSPAAAASSLHDNILPRGADVIAGGVASLLAIGYYLWFGALLVQGSQR